MNFPHLRPVPDPQDDHDDDRSAELPERVNGHGVLVDVDGDGVPDSVTPAAGRDVALRPDAELEPAELAAGEPARLDVVQAVVTPKPGDFLPVVPPWLRTPQGRRNMLRWWLRRGWHAGRFHGLRLPLYALRVAVRAPLGAGRTVGRLTLWAFDSRADAMEQELARSGKGDAETFMKLRKQRSRRVKTRLSSVAAVLVLAAVAAVILIGRGPWWAPQLSALALVVAFARLGTPQGQRLVGATMAASSSFRVLTDVIVYRALRHAGLGGTAPKVDDRGRELTEDTRATLAAPIARAANGSGYLVTADLPYGKTVEDALSAQDRIASGLDVDGTQLFIEKVPGSKRRVTMYVADEDPFTLPPRRSPLAKLPAVSVWDAQPLGTEPQGREALPSLMFNSFLIGAIPRSGKTFAARALIAPALLDPYCDVTILDFKGGRDWKAAEDLAVTFRTGDDEDDLAYGIAVLERLKAEAQDRFKAFRTMTDEENPEGKLTRELARAGLRPHLIVIDEVQNLLRAPIKAIRDEALPLLVWLAKTAPAAGFSLVMATQRPATDVIPSDLRDNTSVRLALRTKTWQASDAILGAGINAAGYGTQRFLEEHKGAAVLGGVSNGRGGDLQVIRTDLIELRDFARICRAGRLRREDAGTLRGMAAGQRDEVVVTVTVVEDVLSVWPNEEPKVQAAVLLARLAEVYPERYGAWDVEDTAALTRALREHGVGTVQVFRDGVNRNGYTLATVRKAATRELES